MSVNLTTSLGVKQLIEATDFHLGCMTCIADPNQGGALKTVPAISPTVGNQLIRDASGKLLVPAAASGSFTITDDQVVPITQIIAAGDTLTFASGTGTSTKVSATDTIEYSVRISPLLTNALVINAGDLFVPKETVTTLTPVPATSVVTYVNEAGTSVSFRRVSADAGNLVAIGTDGGAYWNGVTVTAASWNDATNTLDLTMPNGSVVSIPIIDNVANFIHTHTISDGVNPVVSVRNGSAITYSAIGATVTVGGTSAAPTVAINATPVVTVVSLCPQWV